MKSRQIATHWLFIFSCAVSACFLANPAIAVVPDIYLGDYQLGYDEGFPMGYDTGFTIGFDRGTTEGTQNGESDGYDDGWDSAYQPAYDIAYDISSLIGNNDGYAEALGPAILEGFIWAQEVHQFILQTSRPLNPAETQFVSNLTLRWGDPAGWGSSGANRSAGVELSFVITDISFDLQPVDWPAHYYDEGYHDGYDEGQALGDQQGYDQAYPLAYDAAYAPAFEQGADEGDAQGTLDGSEAGYDDGWQLGQDLGKNAGFTLGADWYAIGGSLAEFPIGSYLTAHANSLNTSVNSVAAIPEPTSLYLGLTGLLLIAVRAPRRLA